MGLLQVISTFFLVYLIAISGAQPVHKGLSRNHHRERRQDKSVSASSTRSGRPCNHISRHTSSSDVSLCYKNGWFLAVHDDGNINGTSDARSLDIKLQLRSVGRSLVRIYSPRNCLYVAMASTGKVYATENPTDETVFQQTQEPSGFETFASNRHYIPLKLNKRKPLFLSMRKTGHMKNGIKTTRNHRTTLLSVIPARETI